MNEREGNGCLPLSNRLAELFENGNPDFEAAGALIRQGADVNDQGDDLSKNLLSRVLMEYGYNSLRGKAQTVPGELPSLVQVIRFFLDHGFDLNRDEGRYGAQCLRALQWSSYDRQILQATKALLDAGARNIPCEPGDEEPPSSSIGTKWSFLYYCENDYPGSNLFEAVYQVYGAQKAGRPYAGIDTYEAAVGKRLVGVQAIRPQDGPVFYTLDLPQSRHRNCFQCDLYLMLDQGYLLCTPCVSCWVDNAQPEEPLCDVSDWFAPVLGSTIREITFDYREISKGTHKWTQPAIMLHMDNGMTLRLTDNAGEDGTHTCGWFSLNHENEVEKQ